MSGQISEKPVLTELCELLLRPVDSQSLQRARLHLLDWIGCAAAGAIEPAGKIFRKANVDRADALAFAWGGLGNILEMDDVDKRALLHPGPSIIPAVLAVTKFETIALPTLLTSIVRGYEATIRLGRAVGSHHYSMWHSTGTCGAIGAAASASTLLGLTQEQTEHAMALAMSQSAGLWQTRHDPESMGKQVHTANAARAGVQSAELAKIGLKGPLRILEGEQGFFQAMCSDGDPQSVLASSPSDWLIHDVSFKPWPACRHAHAVIDAALEIKPQVDTASVSTIRVLTYADALKFCDRSHPRSVIEAKFSLQHAVSVALVKGRPELADFEPEAINDASIKALRERVRVEVSSEFDDVYPGRFGAAIICDDTRVNIPDALGDPENPMSHSQIREKAQTLMAAGGVRADTAARISDMVLNEDQFSAPLIDLLSEVLA